MYDRILSLKPYLEHKSLFLLGPRQTGKSTLLRQRFPDAIYIDLLESETFRVLSRSPEALREMTRNGTRVIIDEIQKLPGLLDEVQLLIDRRPEIRFVLTGSSARKLRRGQANLLGGRALYFELFPLVSAEVPEDDVARLLERGGLPGIFDSAIYWDELKAYVGTYLREEIQAEGLSRSIENFSRFLDVCGAMSGEQLNYTKLGNDAQVPPRTVQDYVQILQDTLVARTLPPFRGGARKTVSKEKFYMFDLGVSHVLRGQRSLKPGSMEFGRALEHQVFQELTGYLHYQRRDERLTYWRTQSQIEVDFVLSDTIAIEVKASGRVASTDLKGLRKLSEEVSFPRRIVVCNEEHERQTDDGIVVMPWRRFFRALWDGKLV